VVFVLRKESVLFSPSWRRGPSIRLKHTSQRAVPWELSPVHQEFPRAIAKSAHIDEQAVEAACAALSKSVLAGNRYQFEALSVVLRSMMPPDIGANQVRGPPPDATIEKSDLVWSEQDYMSGPVENLRQLQGYEAEYAKIVADSKDGFRDPKVLLGALDLAVAYLKNYAVDKADALYAATESYCMERGLPWTCACLPRMSKRNKSLQFARWAKSKRRHLIQQFES